MKKAAAKTPRNLTRDGRPRKKPGPKPKKHARISTIAAASADPLHVACLAAFHAEFAAQKAEGRLDGQARAAAELAYRRTMPTLTFEELEQYIGCVAHGLTVGAIAGPEASRMLYAAQVMRSSRAPATKKPPASDPDGLHT